MKKLKDIAQTKPLTSAGEDYVPDEPIHFKMGSDRGTPVTKSNITHSSSGDDYVPDEPVHFRHVGKLKEAREHDAYEKWLNHNQNSHIEHGTYGISRKLADHVKSNHNLNHNEIHHVKNYSSGSRELNSHLVYAHKNKENVDSYHHQTIHHLDTATKRHIGHNMHLYSGLGFNPHNMKNKNGRVHLPAYTSLTHDKHTADGFAYDARHRNEGGDRHVLHLQVKKKDKGLHVSHLSNYEGEHETILPRNTKIKIHKKPTTYEQHGHKVHVWHAHIVHQD